MSPDALSVLLRALSFVALLQATGIAVFVALFSRHLVGAGDELRWLAAWSAAVALPLLIAQLALEAARMAGEFEGVLDMSLERIVLTSPAAAAFAARVLGLVVIVGGLLRGSRMAEWVACAGSLLVAASYALTGHTAVHPHRLLLASALISHVLIAAFWLGAIPALYLATLREAGDRAGELIELFSRVATWVVPVLAAAGVVMALVLVARLTVLAQPYGWLLLGKVAAFTVLIGLAAVNRSRLGPAVALGATRAFRRSLAAEYALLVAVLAATATMTSLYSPEP